MEKSEQDISFDLPTSWRHGKGTVSQVGEILQQLGLENPLILTDSHLMSSGIVDPVKKSLEKEGISYFICDDVNMEPTVTLFESIIDKLNLEFIDSIIAVGGGSVIDVSKGISIIGTFGGRIRDYDGFDLVPGRPHLKVIAIPTTSGTGSEVSDGVVLIDESRDTKFLVLSKKICPSIAITDPEMTITMPPKVTACSGIDALVHAVESFISKGANRVTELFALKAIALISKGIRPAFHNGNDITARENMQIGATMAMIAAMNSYLGLCHAIAMPLCALYHMPHGQACGMLLPHVMRFNASSVEEKIKKIFHTAGYFDEDNDNAALYGRGYKGLKNLLDEIGISAKLSDFAYQDSHMDVIVKSTLGSAQTPTNPRTPTDNDIADIIKQII